jgi:hypothetical protein
MIAQFAEAYPRTLKPRDPRQFALKVKDQKKQSNKENAAPTPRLRCYMFAEAPSQALVGYVALSQPKVRGTPPTLKQVFVRKPERRKGFATAVLRSLPFLYEDDQLLVEQPVKATHLALESAGWRLVRHDADSWLYCRGSIAANLPSVDLDHTWEWIESEAHGGSRASELPNSLAFYPAILSRASLDRATGDEGVFALLGLCTGQAASAPLYELYDASPLLQRNSTKAESLSGVVPNARENVVAADILPEVTVPSTPLPLTDRMSSPTQNAQMTPGAVDDPVSRKRKYETAVAPEAEPDLPSIVLRRSLGSIKASSEHSASGSSQFAEMELRVVQSDFMHIELKAERRGMRVSSLSTPSVSGIQVSDLIVKVDGIAVHSKARRRPAFRDGMAITIRRQVC